MSEAAIQALIDELAVRRVLDEYCLRLEANLPGVLLLMPMVFFTAPAWQGERCRAVRYIK